MRFGLIGLGGIGRVRATALLRTREVSLVAATDLDPARLARLPPAVTRYADAEALLAATDIDAVVIAVPPPLHEPLTLAALASGKNVLVEKPMAPTVEACERMVEAARVAGRVLTCGFNHRYFPAVKLVREALRSGGLGRLSHVRGYAGHVGLSEFPAPWMHDAAVIGGGTLSDNGIHMIDLVAHLLGDVDQVMGAVSSDAWGLGASEDNGMAILRRADGVAATLHSSWTEWRGYRIDLEAYGERGLARASYAPMSATLVTMDAPGGRRRVRRYLYPDIMLREKLRGWQSTAILTFIDELGDFVGLACGGAGLVIATGEDGLRAVAIADAVRRSSAAAAVVHLGGRHAQSSRAPEPPSPIA